MVTEQLKGRGNTTMWFLFVAWLDMGAHFVCTLLKIRFSRLATTSKADQIGSTVF